VQLKNNSYLCILLSKDKDMRVPEDSDVEKVGILFFLSIQGNYKSNK